MEFDKLCNRYWQFDVLQYQPKFSQYQSIIHFSETFSLIYDTYLVINSLMFVLMVVSEYTKVKNAVSTATDLPLCLVQRSAVRS